MLELPPPTQVNNLENMVSQYNNLVSGFQRNNAQQIQNEYAPQMNQSSLDSQAAGTNYKNVATKFIPVNSAISAENANTMANRTNNTQNFRSSPAYTMQAVARSLGPIAFSLLQKKHPEIIAQLTANTLNAANVVSANKLASTLSPPATATTSKPIYTLPPNYDTGVNSNTTIPNQTTSNSSNNPTSVSSSIPTPVSVSTVTNPTVSPKVTPPVNSGINPTVQTSAPQLTTHNLTPTIQQGGTAAYTEKTVPSGILSQRIYAHLASNIFNMQNSFLPQVATFTGASGYASKKIDSAMASLGANNPQYLAYLKFKQSAPLLSNELRRQMGGQATDSENHIIGQLANPNLGNLTPQQFLTLHNNLADLMNTISSGLKYNNVTATEGLGSDAKHFNPTSNSSVVNPSKNNRSEILQEIANRKKAGTWS